MTLSGSAENRASPLAAGRHYVVQAVADPQLALRVMGLFAQLHTIPSEIRLTCDGASLTMVIIDHQLDYHRESIVLKRIQSMIGVFSAAIMAGFGYCDLPKE